MRRVAHLTVIEGGTEMPAECVRRGAGLPTGIRRRHLTGCPAIATDDMSACHCRPRYQAQVGPRRARKTKTFETLRDAERWRAQLRQKYARRRGHRVPTVADAFEQWLEAMESGEALSARDRPYKARTIRDYRRDMLAHVIPAFGATRLDDLSRGEIRAMQGRLTKAGKAPMTVHNVLTALRALLRWARELEYIDGDPMIRMRVAGVSKAKRQDHATAEQVHELVEALPERDRPLWATAFYAGLRRGELMGLRWADIDLGARRMHVRRAYDPQAHEMASVKSDASERTVHLPSVLIEQLEAHHARHDGTEDALVFRRGSLAGASRGHRGPPDAPFSDDSVRRRARRFWTAAGLDYVHLHAARHSYGSQMMAAGVPTTVISVAMGHASTAITDEVYLHLRPDAGPDAASKLDAHVRQRIASKPL